MSDEIRKDQGASTDDPEQDRLPTREESMPKDHELYTPQGGGGGTGSGPIREVAAVRDESAKPVRRGRDPKILPQVGAGGAVGEALGPGSVGLGPAGEGPLEMGDGGHAPGGLSGTPARPEASAFRLLLTLGLAGALAGALLVFVFLWSQPKILAYRAKVIQEAVTEVLKGPDHFSSLFLLDGALVAQVPEGVDTLDLDRVFLGFDEAGSPVGFAMEAEGFGFQDIIGLIFGYDAETGQVLGMKVLRHLETPGLGDKIVKDAPFVAEFDGVDAPILGVKPDRNTGDPAQVDMITGATISSKAVIRIINERIAELGGLLAAFETGRTEAAEPPAGGVEGDE